MRRVYETPIAEKLEFDYMNVVAASGPSQNNLGTVHEQWCHGPLSDVSTTSLDIYIDELSYTLITPLE